MTISIREILKRGTRRYEEAAQARDHLAALVFLRGGAGAETHKEKAARDRGLAAIAMVKAQAEKGTG